MSFKKHYQDKLNELKPVNIFPSQLEHIPTIHAELFGPGTSATISMFGHSFELDSDGMLDLLDMVDECWESLRNDQKRGFLHIVAHVSNVVDDYLGGRGGDADRKTAYNSEPDHTLTMSDIKGKHIGQCTERSLITHQVLSIMHDAGETHYKSYYVNSYLHVGDEKEPHSFLIFQHDEDPSKIFIYDVENPLSVRIQDGQIVYYPAIYPITIEEFEAFKSGETISPENYWET